MIPGGGYLDNPGTPPGLDAMARTATNTIPIPPAPRASKKGHGPNDPMRGCGVAVPPGALQVTLSGYTGSTQASWSGTSSSSEPEKTKQTVEGVTTASTYPNSQTSSSVDVRTSKDHLDGTCEACVFFRSKHGCARSDQCRYCHLEHPTSSAPRPRKQTRDKIKERVLHLFRENSAELHEELQEEARSHPYACRIIQGYLDDDIPLTFEAEDPDCSPS